MVSTTPSIVMFPCGARGARGVLAPVAPAAPRVRVAAQPGSHHGLLRRRSSQPDPASPDTGRARWAGGASAFRGKISNSPSSPGPAPFACLGSMILVSAVFLWTQAVILPLLVDGMAARATPEPPITTAE